MTKEREEAIATIREALDSCIVAKDRGMAWQHFDGAKVEAAKATPSALSEPGEEAKAMTADRIMEVVEPFMRDDSKYWMEEDRKNLRSRLSELGLK